MDQWCSASCSPAITATLCNSWAYEEQKTKPHQDIRSPRTTQPETINRATGQERIRACMISYGQRKITQSTELAVFGHWLRTDALERRGYRLDRPPPPRARVTRDWPRPQRAVHLAGLPRRTTPAHPPCAGWTLQYIHPPNGRPLPWNVTGCRKKNTHKAIGERKQISRCRDEYTANLWPFADVVRRVGALVSVCGGWIRREGTVDGWCCPIQQSGLHQPGPYWWWGSSTTQGLRCRPSKSYFPLVVLNNASETLLGKVVLK